MALVFEQKLAQLKTAFKTLVKALEQERNEFVRDSIIQRFEFTTELLWKTLKAYLFEEKGIDRGSPKDIMRECRNIGILDESEVEIAIQIIDDRNLSTHTYNEKFANALVKNIESYIPLMQKIIQALSR